MEKVDVRKGKRSKRKEGKEENVAVKLGTEMQEMRKMIQTMMQRQQKDSIPGAGVVAGGTEEVVILLDTYAV